MLKFWKYALLGLLILDVAVAPRACSNDDDYTPPTNKGEVHFFVYEDLGEDVIKHVEGVRYWEALEGREDFQVGDVITEDMFWDYMSNFEISSLKYPGIYEYVVVIKEVSLRDKKEITFPYTLTEEAIEGYYNAIRDAFCIEVVVEFIVESDNVQGE